MAAFGAFCFGPVGHYYFMHLDRFVYKLYRPGNWRFLAVKVGVDAALFSPLSLAAFFSTVTFLEVNDIGAVKEKLKRDFLPTLACDLCVFPVVQIINFKYVPVRHQLLYFNSVCYFWDIFLSWVQHNGMPEVLRFMDFNRTEGQQHAGAHGDVAHGDGSVAPGGEEKPPPKRPDL
jgi:hypothetical protein